MFHVEITLGNAAMSSAEDIARALRDIAARVEGGVISGTVRDANGNSVGSFSSNESDDSGE